jgi:hypothetical protein
MLARPGPVLVGLPSYCTVQIVWDGRTCITHAEWLHDGCPQDTESDEYRVQQWLTVMDMWEKWSRLHFNVAWYNLLYVMLISTLIFFSLILQSQWMVTSKGNEYVALCEEECIGTTQISGLEMWTVLLPEWSWDSSFDIRLDNSGFSSWQQQEILLCYEKSRMALRSTQPSMQLVLWPLSSGVKWPEHEARHWPPSSAWVKNEWSHTSTPPLPLWHLQGHFTFLTVSWGQDLLEGWCENVTKLIHMNSSEMSDEKCGSGLVPLHRSAQHTSHVPVPS